MAYLLYTYSLFTIDISTPDYFSLYHHWAEQPAPLDRCVVFIEIRSSAGLSEVFQSVLKTPTAGQEMEGLMELDGAACHSDQKQYF